MTKGPALNLLNADDDLPELDIVPGSEQEHATQHFLRNGFGFSGVNAVLIVS